MAILTEFLNNPLSLAIAAVVLALVSIIVLVFGALLGRQRRSLEQLQYISKSLSQLEESYVRTNLSLESVVNRLQNIESQCAEEITLATGLGGDEASAIVKFHGVPKR